MKAVIKFKGNIKQKTPYGKVQKEQEIELAKAKINNLKAAEETKALLKELEWNKEASDVEFRNMLRTITDGLFGDEESTKSEEEKAD